MVKTRRHLQLERVSSSDSNQTKESTQTADRRTQHISTITPLPPPLPCVVVNSSSSSSSSCTSASDSSKLSSTSPATPRSELSYEQRRLENIRRNQAMLASLQLPSAKACLRQSHVDSPDSSAIAQATQRYRRKLNRSSSGGVSKGRRKKTTNSVVSRVSRRVRGQTPDSVVDHRSSVDTSSKVTLREIVLVDAEAYWRERNHRDYILVSGKYTGWVNPDLIKQFGLPSSALECKQRAKAAAGQRKGESAREWSATQMHKNPNCYFYRHNAPGYEQWTGDWTDEEKDIFLRVAREYGCGDKWGLFSSYLPHRFGYQCSNFYRAVALKEGHIVDPHYMMSTTGDPVFVGARK
mmetsp:Transcript_7698/g.19433  ORF Transcript_7698/g.19433 Transcript_7698/m.19433 type:complete len:351 (+) Transcript_7698:285-1337(+)|eukprot:CAMPEP_0177673336 /NCGR_PEP_ID=MMETSP0447-20121125/25886_1 /TAXON_ID=0 /ORGANISM="Stygamoeba regulata, Strain BSH-02190019" /LENGTH=350 /DNA_ID=CAMNT_0019181195 /DNA_START=162 /DNA_END=1214 /DNA_ORIENTATION=+